MAVSAIGKAAEILSKVNKRQELSQSCEALANEVATALKKYAITEHPKYGKIYAFEVDEYDSQVLMDDANVPSLLALGRLVLPVGHRRTARPV